MRSALTLSALISTASAVAIGCSADLFHPTSWENACDRDAACLTTAASGPGAGGSGGSSAGSGASGGSSGGSNGSGASGTTGGAGGGGPGCGNGIIEAGEECDPAPGGGADCIGCQAACAGDEQKDPTTLHCFKLFPDTAGQLPWSQAVDACSTRGGYLASITTMEEQAFVATFPVTEYVWIGASDATTRGAFTWVNGEPWSFTYWDVMQPDDFLGGEDCVHMGPMATFHWNDLSCADPHAYLCERELDLR